MHRISQWYTAIGEYSFPTVFLRLNAEEMTALVEAELDSEPAKRMSARLQRAIRAVPGPGFVGADVCVPTDSELFRHGRWVTFGRTAWRLLVGSDKVRAAVRGGTTDCLTVRPFRRMDVNREFRMFFRGRKLAGMSQYRLRKHVPKIAKRKAEIWSKATVFAECISRGLLAEDIVVDVYLCSDGKLLLVDLNARGDPTDPKLLNTWDRDWDETIRLKLIPRPIKMKGDVSVSF